MRKLWGFTLMAAAVLFCSAQVQAADALSLAFNKYDVTVHCNNTVGDYCIRDKNVNETFTFNETAFYVNFGSDKPMPIKTAGKIEQGLMVMEPGEIEPGQSKYTTNGFIFNAIYTTNAYYILECPPDFCGRYPECYPCNPQCPPGFCGTYPNCYYPCTNECLPGYCGTPPSCIPCNPQCEPGFCGTYPNCFPCTPQCEPGYCGTYPSCIPCGGPIPNGTTPIEKIGSSSLYEFNIKHGCAIGDMFIFGKMTIKYETSGLLTGKSNPSNIDYPGYDLEQGTAFFWGVKK